MHFELRPIVDDFDPNSGVSAPTWSEVAGGSPQVDNVTTTPDTDSYANFWLRVTGSEDLRDDDTQDDRWSNEPIAHWPDGWTGSAWAGKTVYGFEMRAKVPKIDGVDATTWFKRLTTKQNRSKVLLV